MVRFVGSALLSSLALAGSTFAQEHGNAEAHDSALETKLWKRTVNQTEFNACQQIQKLQKTSTDTKLLFLPSTPDNHHYMTTSSQASTCVYTPSTPDDLAAAIKIVGSQRIRFAVSCSGHASNQGFSSTPGVHISMKGFQDVTVSADGSSVDIGGGIAWSDVYQKLDKTNVNVVGGRVPGPGIGGFVTGGGGFSWITNQYGLTGDTLIEANMILPNGTLVNASETENPDLFWAIKGGGNNFGVIYNFK